MQNRLKWISFEKYMDKSPLLRSPVPAKERVSIPLPVEEDLHVSRYTIIIPDIKNSTLP